MQQFLQVNEISSRRIRLPDVWELTRRFSGVFAIVVLGAAMITIGQRSGSDGDVAARQIAQPAPPAIEQTQPAAPASTRFMFRDDADDLIVIYYLYETQAQYDQAVAAEAFASLENEMSYGTTLHQYKLLDMSTPDAEAASRSELFDAMLAAPEDTRIFVTDLRQR